LLVDEAALELLDVVEIDQSQHVHFERRRLGGILHLATIPQAVKIP
jgi:hypothetical protein